MVRFARFPLVSVDLVFVGQSLGFHLRLFESMKFTGLRHVFGASVPRPAHQFNASNHRLFHGNWLLLS